MIVNKQLIDCVLDTGEPSKMFVVSYIDKEGDLKQLTYKLPLDQLFNWEYARSRNDNADPIWKSWDNKLIKKVPTTNLSDYRLAELLCSFGDYVAPLYENNFPKQVICDIEVNVTDSGFPEVTTAENPVNTIAICEDYEVTVLARKDLTQAQIKSIQKKLSDYTKKYGNYHFNFIYFANEADMLLYFFKFIKDKPAVTGWNFLGYDWMYLYNRCDILGIDISFISPTGKFYNFGVDNKSGKINVKLPYHKLVYDYLMVYKKWDYAVKYKENNTLDYVAEQVLGIKKVDHKLGFKEFYEKEYEDYVFYNAIDVVLVNEIHNTLKTANIFTSMANIVKCNAMEAFSTIKPIETAMVSFLYDENKVIPTVRNKKPAEDADYEGAFVWPTVPNAYQYVLGFDFASLYPSIIRQFNISSDTFKFKNLHHKRADNEIKTSSGAVFTKEFRGLLPRFLDYYFEKRKEAKGNRKRVDTEKEYLNKILEVRKAGISKENFKED